MPLSKFERRLEILNQGGQTLWVSAFVEVLDTAETVAYWAEDHKIKPDFDLTALVELIIRRHDALKAEEIG